MDASTAQALFEERMTREPERLAIEVVTLRSFIDALMGTTETLSVHIKAVALEAGNEQAMIRGAGGLAVIDLLDKWIVNTLSEINDAMTEAGP